MNELPLKQLLIHTLLISLLTLFSVAPTEQPAFKRSGLLINNQKAVLFIDRNTTRNDLRRYKAELLEKKNSQLDVQQLTVDERQRINYIEIAVDCRDGFLGYQAISLPKRRSTVGFCHVYNEPGRSPFEFGANKVN